MRSCLRLRNLHLCSLALIRGRGVHDNSARLVLRSAHARTQLHRGPQVARSPAAKTMSVSIVKGALQ